MGGFQVNGQIAVKRELPNCRRSLKRTKNAFYFILQPFRSQDKKQIKNELKANGQQLSFNICR